MKNEISSTITKSIAEMLMLNENDIELDMHLIQELDFDLDCLQNFLGSIEERFNLELEFIPLIELNEELNCFVYENLFSDQEDLIKIETIHDLLKLF